MQHHSIVPDACSLGRFFCVLTISLHSIRLWFIVNLTDRKNGNDNNWRARTCNCHPHIWWRRSKIAAKPSRAPTKCNETIERDAKSFYKKKFFRLSTNRISFHLFCCPQFWWDNLIRIPRKKKNWCAVHTLESTFSIEKNLIFILAVNDIRLLTS